MSAQRVMVYLKEDDKKGRKAVTASTTKVLASYTHGLLVEADDAQLEDLQKKGYSLEVQKQATMIRLRAVQFDTAVAAPAVPRALTLTAAERRAERKRDFWLVKFVGPVKAEWGEQVTAAGAKIGDYVPENAFLVEMSTPIADKVRALPFVDWVGPYEPAYKVSPLLMGQKKGAVGDELATRAFAAEAFKPEPQGNLTILVHAPSDLDKVVKAVKDLGGSVVAAEGNTIRASLGAGLTDKLAKMVEVKWIEPYKPAELANDVAAQIITVQPAWNDHELDGEGQIIAVADSGLDTGVNDNTIHADFRGRIVAIHDPAGDGADDVLSGHGTHVTGSALGDGTASNGAIKGMAPAARLVFQALGWNQLVYNKETLPGIPADLNTLFQQAYDDGARIHTNSWGVPDYFGQYTSASQDIDEFMWNHKDSVILFAAGNEGRDGDADGIVDGDSIRPEGVAKNCITVGASENNRASGGYNPGGVCSTYGTCWPNKFPAVPLRNDRLSDDPGGMVAFSSRGPTDDGRPKPDVVAPGTNVLSVRSAVAVGAGNWGELPVGDPNRPFYWYMGGTSMATPLTAGTVALIRQYLQNACGHAHPSGALLKAVLIHGAVPMAGQYSPPEVGTVPDNSQGWGRVDLTNSLFPQHPTIWRFYDDPAATLATGGQRSFTVTVKDTSVPFRATLVWTDYPSNPSSGGGLVNELRLGVVAPNGTSVLGTPAGNNVQQVVIANPQAGTYTVQVTGTNVRTIVWQRQPQDFALVLSAGLDFVDLYIKDNPADSGSIPSVRPWNQSPDIILRPDIARKRLLVWVKVHNRGSKTAKKARVCLYWAKVPVLSRRSWKSNGILVGSAPANCQLLDVPARGAGRDGEATTGAFELVPSATVIGDLSRLHLYWLIATVSHTDDPIGSGLGRWDNNVAAKAVSP